MQLQQGFSAGMIAAVGMLGTHLGGGAVEHEVEVHGAQPAGHLGHALDLDPAADNVRKRREGGAASTRWGDDGTIAAAAADKRPQERGAAVMCYNAHGFVRMDFWRGWGWLTSPCS